MLIGKIDYENKNDITMDGILHRKNIYIYIYFRYGEKEQTKKKIFFFRKGRANLLKICNNNNINNNNNNKNNNNIINKIVITIIIWKIRILIAIKLISTN